jgi:predicted MFS family arabinose efflux permease
MAVVNPQEQTMSRLRLIGFGAALLVAMFVSTFPQYALGVLAPVLLNEFALGEGTFGLLMSLLFFSAAIVARLSGRMLDVIRGRTALGIVFAGAVGSLTILAFSPTTVWLVAVVLVAGVAAAINNPVTNRLIAVHVTAGRRGPLMGVKQVGVKLAHMAAGAVLPLFVFTIGWRQGLLVVAGIGVAVFFVGAAALPPEPPPGDDRRGKGSVPIEVRRQVRWLQVFAASMAIGMSALTAYLALYGVERVGMSLTTAGLVVAAMGLTSVVGRLIWATVAERLQNPPLALIILSCGGILGLIAISAAEGVGAWLLWVGAIGTGATAGSWNVVVQLTVVTEVETSYTAAASGGVQSAFLAGLTVGAPLFGTLVEATDSFQLAWFVAAMLATIALATALRERVRRREPAVGGTT